MKNKGLNKRNTTPASPYGPATGVSDPGLQPTRAEHPYEGARHPEGAYRPGHAPGGPGHEECEHN